jgi:pyruvate/2-oxoglutarate dehydrogenase complex dihydrolipoamide acyltransferase (E2) component
MPNLEVTLLFDHRVIDNGYAQRLMARIREDLVRALS